MGVVVIIGVDGGFIWSAGVISGMGFHAINAC